MTSFRYVEFYDYPRYIVLNYRGKLVLLQSAFDEERDDYPDGSPSICCPRLRPQS
jgi:hypothetical protein